jgi:hypothetical protein
MESASGFALRSTKPWRPKNQGLALSPIAEIPEKDRNPAAPVRLVPQLSKELLEQLSKVSSKKERPDAR